MPLDKVEWRAGFGQEDRHTICLLLGMHMINSNLPGECNNPAVADWREQKQLRRQVLLVFVLCSSIMLSPPGIAGPHTKIDAIRDAARQFIVTTLGGDNPDTKITVKPLDPRLRLAACEHPLEVYLAPGTQLQGHSTVGVRCNTPHPWALFVPVYIEQWIPVLTARTAIRRGQILAAEDLVVKKQPSTSLPGNYLKSNGELVGQVATRDIVASSVLTYSMFKPEKLVIRGQRVMLSSKNGAIAVRVSGIAMSDGARGDRIKVKNLSSKRIIDGTVSDRNTILVGAGSIY